jgi:hypothetical protein
MKIKLLLGVILLASWLGGSTAHGQSAPIFPPPSPTDKDGKPLAPPETPDPPSGVLSDWIVGRRACCEGPPGIITPMFTEVYMNVGASFPVGGMTLSRELKTGWSVTGGTRALFFNEAETSAWAVDLHIINTNESAGKQNTQFPVLFFQNGVPSNQVLFRGNTGLTKFSIQNANRTLAGLGVGKEWYIWKPATSDDCKWRFGVDFGGRWGSQRVNFNEFDHLVGPVEAVYADVHSEMEIPWGRWMFHAGVRIEWAYDWSNVLQRVSDAQDISLMITMGVRF